MHKIREDMQEKLKLTEDPIDKNDELDSKMFEVEFK